MFKIITKDSPNEVWGIGFYTVEKALKNIEENKKYRMPQDIDKHLIVIEDKEYEFQKSWTTPHRRQRSKGDKCTACIETQIDPRDAYEPGNYKRDYV